MNKKPDKPTLATALRRRTDERLKRRTSEDTGQNVGFYDSAPVAHLTLAREGTISEINLTGTALLAKERGKLLGGHFARLIAAGDRDRWRRLFRGLMEQDEWQAGEFELERADGTISSVWLDCWRASSKDGSSGARVTLTDTTKPKVREFEYSTIFNLTPALLCVASADGRFLRVNTEWERVLGFSREELLKIGYTALIHPDDVTPTKHEIARQLRGHSTVGFVNRYRHKDGSYRFLEWQATSAIGGHLYATALDITERKWASDQLLRSEKQYHTLFNAIDEGFCIIEVIFDKDKKPIDYRFLETNPSFERQTGLVGAQGKTMRELAPKHEDYWFEIYGKIAVTGQPARFVNRAEQLHRWYDVYAFRIDQPEKRKVAILFNDISERKQMEKRVQRFTHEIIAAREDERRQVASALHNDVGSLAVGMSAYIDAIQDELRSGRSAEAHRLTKRARKLFDESVARLKELAVQLRPPELDVLGLSAALRHHFSQITKRNGIRIQFRVNLGSIQVPASIATTLFRIAQEALTNAITHGHAKQVNVRLDASREEIRLSVHDNGKGFNWSAIGDQDTSRMGLRVMQEMAAFAEGAFSVDSRPEQGTTVRVSLPRRTAALAPADIRVRKEAVAPNKTAQPAGRGAKARKRSRI